MQPTQDNSQLPTVCRQAELPFAKDREYWSKYAHQVRDAPARTTVIIIIWYHRGNKKTYLLARFRDPCFLFSGSKIESRNLRVFPRCKQPAPAAITECLHYLRHSIGVQELRVIQIQYERAYGE